MKKLFLSFFIFSINVFFLGCKKDTKETNPTIEVTLVNMGFSAWRVVSVQNSSNFGVLDMNNTPFTFIRGRRYRIISMANVAVHPFEFRNTMNLPVLSQNQMNMGSLATDESINFVSDA
ncbi:MAG: hypothetical protein MUE71_05785, partial [Chitinophagaceae bacterium]|nr:hypothetical protein [Chitinophagaceae bacterium]